MCGRVAGFLTGVSKVIVLQSGYTEGSYWTVEDKESIMMLSGREYAFATGLLAGTVGGFLVCGLYLGMMIPAPAPGYALRLLGWLEALGPGLFAGAALGAIAGFFVWKRYSFSDTGAGAALILGAVGGSLPAMFLGWLGGTLVCCG